MIASLYQDGSCRIRAPRRVIPDSTFHPRCHDGSTSLGNIPHSFRRPPRYKVAEMIEQAFVPFGTHNVLAVILGGGRGTRLFPLTQDRAKPAVPLGGKYRLVDIPISNCINS